MPFVYNLKRYCLEYTGRTLDFVGNRYFNCRGLLENSIESYILFDKYIYKVFLNMLWGFFSVSHDRQSCFSTKALIYYKIKDK